MGCYQNTGRALADILRGVNGKRTVSKKLNVCRKTADAKGITVFGLDDKQCWTGQNAADTFNKYGNSGQCYTNKGGKSQGHPTTVFGEISVRSPLEWLKFSGAQEQLKISKMFRGDCLLGSEFRDLCDLFT